MLRHPVAGDVDAAADPHAGMFEHMIEDGKAALGAGAVHGCLTAHGDGFRPREVPRASIAVLE